MQGSSELDFPSDKYELEKPTRLFGWSHFQFPSHSLPARALRVAFRTADYAVSLGNKLRRMIALHVCWLAVDRPRRRMARSSRGSAWSRS